MRASPAPAAQRSRPARQRADGELARIVHGLEQTSAVTASAILGTVVATELPTGRRRTRRVRGTAPFAADAFAFMEALPMAVLWLDPAGIVRHCNARALQCFGSPLLGNAWRAVLARQPSASALADSLQSNAYRNGQLIVCQVSAQPALAERIRERVRERDRERERMLARLGRLSAGLAHQLRTPITAAQLYLDLAIARGESRYLTAAQSALDALTRHCESVLTLARGELRMDDGVQVDAIATLLARQTAGLRGSVTIDATSGTALLRCNPHLLVGALANLVDNALRATPVGSARVAFLSLDTTLDIVIDDDGPGFPIEWLPYRGDLLRSTRSDGSGLGLAMANLMIEAHGGSLDIANRLGGGARVVVRLPRQAAFAPLASAS